ncbi:MAG: hypothetical protein AAF414_02115 [Pseudomonadota bacterium]
MVGLINQLKAHARILHREATAGNASALARLGRLAAFKGKTHAETANAVRRRHCLTVLANELGFDGWPALAHATVDGEAADFGTFLHPPNVWAHWNIWCATYEEAKAIREEHGGYLLCYKHQFLVVDADYVDTMGVPSTDPDWDRIGRDWVRPAEIEARERLCEKLARHRLGALEFRPS